MIPILNTHFAFRSHLRVSVLVSHIASPRAQYAQPKKSIWINLFAQLNPGFGGNNYLLNWGTAPRSLVFIGGFLWVSVVYAALLSGFGVLWWVSVMLVSFLLGFGVFLTGFGVFWGFPGVSSHCALLSVFFAQLPKC